MSFLGLVLAFYIVVIFAAYAFQRKLQYFPSTERIAPAKAGLSDVQEIILTTPDTEKLVAWYTQASKNKPTILYFHGNAAGLIDRAERMGKYQALGFGFFMPAYRGFAGSSGSPSEKALIADARLAYEYLLKRGVRPEDIVVFGESLGTSVATQLAASVKVGAVILESPFTSAANMGALLYPFLPVRYLMNDQYRSDQYISSITAPVLVIHGGRDEVVPLAMGKQMFKLANQPKQFVLLPEAGHNDHDQFGLIAKVQEFTAKNVLVK
jgi:uncharacterized protein